MANNINITSGAGVIVVTDQDPSSSAHYQKIKLVDANLNSTNATGVATNPLIVSVSNTTGTVSVLNTLAVISVLNTVTTVSVLNTVTSVSVLNTVQTVAVSNTSATVSVLNTVQTVAVSNTSATISVLNTLSTVSVLNTVQTVAVSNTSATVSVLNTVTSVSVLNTVQTVAVSNTSSTISVLNTGGNINVLNTRTSVTVSGGVTLLSSVAIAVKKDIPNYSPTWIYAALSSAVNTAVWTPASGRKFNITDLTVSVLTAGKVTFSQSVTGSTIMVVELAANGGWATNLQTPYVATATNTPLAVVSTVAGTATYVCISGYED